MVKIQTFDAVNFWKNSYAHQSGKLLRKLNVEDEKIKENPLNEYLKNLGTWRRPHMDAPNMRFSLMSSASKSCNKQFPETVCRRISDIFCGEQNIQKLFQ